LKMRMNGIILLGIVFLILENAVVPWLVPPAWSDRLLPHLTFVLTMFVAAFAGRHPAFLFGLGFGMLQDLLSYGELIGPYAFGMGLLGYLVGLLAEYRTFSVGVFAWVTVMAGVLLDSIVYFIYNLFRLTELSYAYALYWQAAPTALLQLLIALLIYVPVRRYLAKTSSSQGEDSSE